MLILIGSAVSAADPASHKKIGACRSTPLLGNLVLPRAGNLASPFNERAAAELQTPSRDAAADTLADARARAGTPSHSRGWPPGQDSPRQTPPRAAAAGAAYRYGGGSPAL